MLDLQPQNLEDNLVKIIPLKEYHFNELFEAAADKLTWNQHPNPLRYQLQHFKQFFEGAIKSAGAFVVKEKISNKIIGSTRYYNYDQNLKSIYIGYTFIDRNYWGKGFNFAVKLKLLRHAFLFVKKVYFQIGATNFRSQKAIIKLGAILLKEEMVEYYKEEPKLNYLYVIDKLDFLNQFKTS